MIISCDCGVRLKVSDEKLTDAGVRIKCPKCGTVHLAVRPRPQDVGVPPAESARPAAPPRPEPAMPWFAPASAAMPAPAGGGSLVLVAHDSKVVADMIDGVLKNAGMSTIHAANGLEALRMATDLKPQAMVVDVGLTGIYGFELCERLKGDPDTKGIRIILLSSVYGLTAYKRSPENLYGADDYIEKHHIPDKLVPKLQNLISGGAGAGMSPAGQASSGAPETAPVAEARVSPPAPPVRPAPREEQASLLSEPKALEIPDIPSIMPKTPVTLATSRKRTDSVTSRAAVPSSAPAEARTQEPARPAVTEKKIEEPRPAPVVRASAPARPPEPAMPAREVREAPVPAHRGAPLPDASIKLDASFFEHEEYAAPAVAASRESADPAEIEKAKRFARIIVSDIVLYNQDAVAEGVRDGTFFDLLKDDIAEGRSVYAERVPEPIRRNRDYLQEAFDDFLASKKKHR